MLNTRRFIREAEIADLPAQGDATRARTREAPFVDNGIDVNALPDGVVTGTTLLDLSKVPEAEVRSGISLAMLFASRVAIAKKPSTEDAWLAEYQNALSGLGFSIAGSAEVKSEFKRLNASVHEAIIPFLTVALGGAAIGPVIFALLENLRKMQADTPWITAFDQQTKRFDAHEMHFAAAIPNGGMTSIRYAVARLHIKNKTTQILFFKLSKADASFESLTTTLAIDNRLIAASEEDLQQRLSKLTKSYIWETPLS